MTSWGDAAEQAQARVVARRRKGEPQAGASPDDRQDLVVQNAVRRKS
jgi:hypothetical protein